MDRGGAEDVEQRDQVGAGDGRGQGVGTGVEREDQLGVVVTVGKELVECLLRCGENLGFSTGESEVAGRGSRSLWGSLELG